jgi:uncharacterized protein YidB (DUF937 family)
MTGLQYCCELIFRREKSMGLLDDLVGNMLGSARGGRQSQAQAQDPLSSILAGLTGGNPGTGGNLLLQLVLAMLQQNGGLGSALGRLRERGLEAQADSWVGTGPNMGVSPTQLEEVFGSATIDDIAARLGISHDQAGSAMSQVFPEVVNQLTPQGRVTSESEDSIDQGLNALTKSLGL